MLAIITVPGSSPHQRQRLEKSDQQDDHQVKASDWVIKSCK